MAKRARDIIETRFDAIKVEENIEDSDQLEEITVDEDIDFDEPKAIVVALREFKNNEIDYLIIQRNNGIPKFIHLPMIS